MQPSITFAIVSLTSAYLGIQQNLLAPLIVSGICIFIAIGLAIIELTECEWLSVFYEKCEEERCEEKK